MAIRDSGVYGWILVILVILVNYVSLLTFDVRQQTRSSLEEVIELDSPISACRCARKLILFLFPWIFRSLSSKMLLVFHLYDAVTS